MRSIYETARQEIKIKTLDHTSAPSNRDSLGLERTIPSKTSKSSAGLVTPAWTP